MTQTNQKSQSFCLHDKKPIERLLRKDVYLNNYGLGDLDDFFWRYTTWYGLGSERAPREVAVVYSGGSMPTLIAMTKNAAAMRTLLEKTARLLPPQFGSHLSPGLDSVFRHECTVEEHGTFYKMALRRTRAVERFDSSGVVRLQTRDLQDILRFFKESYPANWFSPRMLGTRQYFGVREGRRLVSVAGVHVYSPAYGVAALGNIATHPSCRGRGLATRVTARLCQSLLESIPHIGLNVKCDNASALACYRRLGFEICASYGEFLITKK